MKRILRCAVDLLVYGLIRATFAIIQTVSVETMQPVCYGLGVLCSDILKLRKKTIDENLRIAMPTADQETINQLRRNLWEHLCLMACEVAWSRRRIHLSNWRKVLHFTTAAHFMKPFLDGRPIIFVTGHFGNFEVGGYATGLFGIPTVTVARTLDNPFLHRYIEQFRGAHGQQMIDKNGTAEIIQQHIEQGGSLSLIADQFAGERGSWVNFFRKPTSCHKALALFTLTNDAPMIVMYTRRIGKPLNFEIGCTGTADPREGGPHTEGVNELTRWYNHKLEEIIALSPEQYWWMHRRWRPVPEKVARRLARQAQAA